ECRQRIDALNAVVGLAWAAVRGKDMAAESGGTARHLSPDPTEPDDPQCRSADLAMRRAAVDPARRPGRAQAEIALDLAEAMAPGEHDHQHVFGNRGLVAIRVADRDPARQGGLLDPFDAGRTRLHERDPRRRWIICPTAIRDENVCRRSRFGG